MSKNKKWSYELKVEFCERLIAGESYSNLVKSLKIR